MGVIKFFAIKYAQQIVIQWLITQGKNRICVTQRLLYIYNCQQEQVLIFHIINKKTLMSQNTPCCSPLPIISSYQCIFQLEKLIEKNYFLHKSAVEGYKSFVRAYSSHSLKNIFNVHQLDLKAVARSFGFQNPPYVDLGILLLHKLTFISGVWKVIWLILHTHACYWWSSLKSNVNTMG